MNIAEYISSGILEQYIAHTLSPQERQEVECMSHIYPEIKEELLSLQQALEDYAQIYSIDPKPSLKGKIFAEIEKLEHATPKMTSGQKEPEVKVIPLKPNYNWVKYVAAASVLVSLGLGWQWLNQYSKAEALGRALAQTQEKNKFLQATLDRQASYLTMAQNPDYKKIVLKGIPAKSAEAYMSVYWDTKRSDVHIDITHMPATASDQQYQLWAIKDGNPVDLGVFDADVKGIVKMKAIEGAQAFAVTLERKGGSPTPTLSEMYVMGQI